jgi:hypothetical protein
MTNVNDYYVPTTGKTLKSDGTVINIADSYNPDGSLNVSLTGSKEGVLLNSQARTSTTISPNQINNNAKGVHVSLNITVASGTGGLIVKIVGFDPITGNFYNLNPSPTAITATGTYIFEVYPGATGGTTAGNQEMIQRTSGALPRTWGVRIFHNDGSSYTYAVGYSLIL